MEVNQLNSSLIKPRLIKFNDCLEPAIQSNDTVFKQANSYWCSFMFSEARIVPAERTDKTGRTKGTAAPTAPSSTVVLKTKGQTSNMQAVVSTKRKSKASCTQTDQRDTKPSGIKHVCKVCDKECRTPSKLKVHIRVHSGERPYMCKVCD